MSEAELIELMNMALDSVASHGMNFFTFLFGYLAVAYLVAEKLTWFQLISLTFFYAIVAPFPAMATYQASLEYIVLSTTYYSQYRPTASPPVLGPNLLTILPIILAGTWILSVFFMMQTRRTRSRV